MTDSPEEREPPAPASPRRIRLAVAAAAAAMLALLLLKISPLTFVDPDLFHQISLARALFETGALPRSDVFAYTPTVDPVVHHEWGAGVIWLAVASLGRHAFLGFKYLLVAGVIVLAAWSARRRGASGPVLVVAALPAALLAHYGFTTIRPQVLSMLALAGLLALLAPEREGRARLWLLAWLPAQLVWTNVHAGFVVGLGFLGVETVERALRREAFAAHAALTFGCALLVLANPWGVDYVTYLAGALSMERPNIPEWAPLWVDLDRRWLDLLLWSVVAGLGAYAVRVRGWRACRGVGMLAIALAFGLLHLRHVTLLAVTFFALVPGWLQGTPLEARIGEFFARRATLVIALGVLGAVVLAGGAALRDPFTLRVPTDPVARLEGWPTYPVGAADYLTEQGFDGNLMTPFVEGAYMMWRLHPEGARISFDGRYEVAYPPEVAEAHATFYGGAEGWYEALSRYPTDVVLVSRESPVVGAMQAAPGWRVVYGDDLYVLVARDGVELPFVDHRGRRFGWAFP